MADVQFYNFDEQPCIEFCPLCADRFDAGASKRVFLENIHYNERVKNLVVFGPSSQDIVQFDGDTMDMDIDDWFGLLIPYFPHLEDETCYKPDKEAPFEANNPILYCN